MRNRKYVLAPLVGVIDEKFAHVRAWSAIANEVAVMGRISLD